MRAGEMEPLLTVTVSPARTRIDNPVNLYRDDRQGTAENPVTIAALLDLA